MRIKIILFSFFIFVLGVAGLMLLPASTAGAIDACSGSDTYICKSSPESLTGSNGIFTNAISVLLYIAGTVAVIMIVVGALRYITSDGDSSKASQARLTVIYSVVGLVIAIMSYGIVNFVVGRL